MSPQARISAWVREALGEETATNAPERSLRTAEEALELAQACGVEAAVLHRLVDYVFSRPVGKPAQEIAGTLVTLYSVAAALGIDADEAFETEYTRICKPEVIERCRRRQGEKRAALVELTGDEIIPGVIGEQVFASGSFSVPVDLGFDHTLAPLTDEQVARALADLEKRSQ